MAKNKYKGENTKEIKFEERNKKTHSILLQHCNPKMEGNLKGIDTQEKKPRHD